MSGQPPRDQLLSDKIVATDLWDQERIVYLFNDSLQCYICLLGGELVSSRGVDFCLFSSSSSAPSLLLLHNFSLSQPLPRVLTHPPYFSLNFATTSNSASNTTDCQLQYQLQLTHTHKTIHICLSTSRQHESSSAHAMAASAAQSSQTPRSSPAPSSCTH